MTHRFLAKDTDTIDRLKSASTKEGQLNLSFFFCFSLIDDWGGIHIYFFDFFEVFWKMDHFEVCDFFVQSYLQVGENTQLLAI